MASCNLMLHTGARTVSREQLAETFTPAATPTWQPIPHSQLLDGISGQLQGLGMGIVNESHGLTIDGNRYFGLLQVGGDGGVGGDAALIIGVRNSHDKKFPAGLVVGSSVFVCDNLSFSGEVRLARKHTVHIQRDLPQLISRAMGRLIEARDHQDRRFAAYKTTEIGDAQAHDFIIRAIDAQVVPVTRIPDVIKEWRTPRHPEFAQAKNGWRLFNSFTEALKGNVDYLPRRTIALHGMMDAACGVALAREIPAEMAS